MRIPAVATLLFTSCLLATPALADDAIDHFKGEPAPSLQAALANLATYNPQLQALLAKGQLDNADMMAIHQLTYTLENALARLDDEVDLLEEALEAVHKASENADPATVLEQGRIYLDKASLITR